MTWNVINPLPDHGEKVEIFSFNKIILAEYDSIEREFIEVREGNHFFYDLDKVVAWRKLPNSTDSL